MSRTTGLITFVIGLMMAGGAFAQCGPVLETSPDGPGWTIMVTAPCAPYMPVEIAYGGLTIHEETGAAGTVQVILPVLADVADGFVRLGDETLRMERPLGLGPSAFFWIDPVAVQPGILTPVGFPTQDGTPQPEMRIFPDGIVPGFLDLPVHAGNCGRALRFDLLRSGWMASRPVSIRVPGCEMIGGRVRLPLPTQ